VSLTALCPGTFDPVTNGHLDIIERAAGLFDEVVVAVVANPSKEPMFSLDERRRMLEESLESLENVRVDSFEGLLVDYARERGVRAVVKGIRAISDFDYELQMAQMNHRLAGVETCFIPTNPIWSYLSSSLVKEVARLGGDVSGLVPDHVLTLLKERI
jgi:pantetheine-phosphate adenylyltransferase